MKIISAYTDKGGWMVNPMAGAADPTPMPDDQYNSGKAGIYIGGPLYDYAAKGSTIELTSKDDKTYTIKLTTKDKVEYSFGIDGEDVPAEHHGNDGTDAGPVGDADDQLFGLPEDGYGIHGALQHRAGFRRAVPDSMTVKKIELNKTIDEAIFAMPKA